MVSDGDPNDEVQQCDNCAEEHPAEVLDMIWSVRESRFKYLCDDCLEAKRSRLSE